MQKLTIIDQRSQLFNFDDIAFLENKFNLKFPEFLIDFFRVYQSARIKERYYNGEPIIKKILFLRKHETSASTEEILDGHIFHGYNNYIPFAIDSGGWDYNVSINPDTYGQVWVDKFDSGEENPFEFVCNSFEEFINGLTENE
jgi:hypothetical protein